MKKNGGRKSHDTVSLMYQSPLTTGSIIFMIEKESVLFKFSEFARKCKSESGFYKCCGMT
jgi:hypothetical protein